MTEVFIIKDVNTALFYIMGEEFSAPNKKGSPRWTRDEGKASTFKQYPEAMDHMQTSDEIPPGKYAIEKIFIKY